MDLGSRYMSIEVTFGSKGTANILGGKEAKENSKWTNIATFWI